jgi:hypothetical protein
VRSPGNPPSGRPRRGYSAEPRDADTALSGEIVASGRPPRRALPPSRHAVPDDDYNFDHLRSPAPDPPAERRSQAASGERRSQAASGERRSQAGPPPSWQARIRPARPAMVRPGPAVAIMLTAAAALAWLLVVAYGFDHLPLLWTLAAFVTGGGGLALTVRGFPVPGAIALLVGVVGWGLATRDLVPQAATDILGDLRLFAWNLMFAAPLLLAYLAALRVDARRSAHAEVRSVVEERRWWGGEQGDHEPRLGVLEAIPSVRFFAVPGNVCTHLVVAGRQVALVGSTVWPRGEYTNDQTDVLRGGRFFGPGTDDVAALMTDTRTWVKRFSDTPVTCRAFLVVHPASDRLTDGIRLALPPTEYAELVHSDSFAEVVGEFLMREPYRIDVQVIQLLMEKLGERAQAGTAAAAPA